MCEAQIGLSDAVPVDTQTSFSILDALTFQNVAGTVMTKDTVAIVELGCRAGHSNS